MGFNPIKMMQARSAMAQFEKRHPKVRGFLESVSADALQEGTVVEVSVTTPQGKNYITNIKVTREDIELFQDARRISRGRQQERELLEIKKGSPAGKIQIPAELPVIMCAWRRTFPTSESLESAR